MVCLGCEQKLQTRGFLKLDTGFHNSDTALNRLCCGLPGTVGHPVGWRGCGLFVVERCLEWRSDISSAVPSPANSPLVPPGCLSMIPVKDCIMESEVLVISPDNPSSNLIDGKLLIICCVLQMKPYRSWPTKGLRLSMSDAKEEKVLMSSLNSIFYSSSCRFVPGRYKAFPLPVGGYSEYVLECPVLDPFVMRYLCWVKCF